MQKVLKKFLSFGLAVAMLFGVTAVARTTTECYVVADAATTTAETYYSGITAASGNALLGQLHDLLTTTHKYYTSYSDVKKYSVKTDPGAGNDTVMEFYTHIDINNSNFDTSGGWNREHVWAKSLSNGCWDTSGGGSDLHHIRPAEKDLNNHRGNMKYGEVSGGKEEYTSVTHVLGGHSSGSSNTGTFEPLDNVKGDVARIVMYVYTQYNKATNVNGTAEDSSYFGNLNFTHIMGASNEDAAKQLLLKWNKLDPVDSIETLRNEEVYKIQGNRNPFIDNSSYADAIWGDGTTTPVDPINPTPDNTLTAIKFNTTEFTLNVGGTQTITVTPTPSNAQYSLNWTSTEPDVATVENGKVTALSAGTATIVAQSTANPYIYASANVTVLKVTTPTPSDTFGAGSYKIALNIPNKKLYFTGSLSGYYGATDTDIGKAATVVAEKTEYGYTLKVGNQYLELDKYENTNGQTQAKLVLNSSAKGDWVFDSELHVLTFRLNINGKYYYLGSYINKNTGLPYETISASETKYISGNNADDVGVSQFPVVFEKVGASASLQEIIVTPSTLSLKEGETSKLSYLTVPTNMAADVTWTSSNTSVATVSADGTVTAVKEGNAIIKATYKSDSGIYSTANITVASKVEPPKPTKLEMLFDYLLIEKGDDRYVRVKDHENYEIAWSSSNTAIATINEEGEVVGIKAGMCVITATLKSDPTLKGTCNITVYDNNDVLIYITWATDWQNIKRMNIGETDQARVDFIPEDKSVEVTWSSSDESVVKVDQNGNVTAVGQGTAEIIITSKFNPGIKAASTVVVSGYTASSGSADKFIAAVAKLAQVTDETTMQDLHSAIVDAVKIYNTLNSDEKASVATVKDSLAEIINVYNLLVNTANQAAQGAEENAIGGVGDYVKRGE